jgi:hypothetical protein
MGAFLRENWIWIAAPILLVVGLIVVVIVLGGGGGVGEFTYVIH